MTLPAPIDWRTPVATLTALLADGAPDPFGVGLIVETIISTTGGAPAGEGPAYDVTYADIVRSLAGSSMTRAQAAAAVQASPAATDITYDQGMFTADILTRLINQANIAIAAYPWVPGTRPPAGLRIGWPWLAP
jgi:hypothetical protein